MSLPLTQTPEWRALEQHRRNFTHSLQDLQNADPVRNQTFNFTHEGLSLNLAKCHVTNETLKLLANLASARDVEGFRDRMISGSLINTTENRAVLHTALRAEHSAHSAAIVELHQKMAAFVERVRLGRWLGATGQKIRHIVNIGIGGSDLGPRLVVGALKSFASGPKVHFVANADATDLLDVLTDIEPAETLFVIVSKTFTTQETLLNAHTARKWLVQALGDAAVVRHFVAVSTNTAAMREFGIDPENAFTMWDWVGGRFSLWSSVGLSIALAIGWQNFEQLLAGAAAMDRHFTTAPLARNLPVLQALISIWYRNFWSTQAEAVLPYAERLRELPRFLQQLEMESNGKRVDRAGNLLDYSTAPVVFGECGTIGQHSFHQWLHQGTDPALACLIGVEQDQSQQPEHHNVLLANLRAQADALAFGHHDIDLHRTNPGNRPSSMLWLKKLDPYHLGLLLAFYEHKVVTQGIIWNINSFDQFGVELGKQLAHKYLAR